MQATTALGVRGYVPMNMPLDGVLSALHIIEVGGTFVPASALLEFRMRGASADRRAEQRTTMLTATQLLVGQAIREGKVNKQIAYELDMRESTVKVHIRNIMKKLRARNRTDVAVKIRPFLITSDSRP